VEDKVIVAGHYGVFALVTVFVLLIMML